MRKTYLLLFLILPSLLSVGQKLTFSGEQKVSNKTPRFRVLGENFDGIVLRRYGKTTTELDVYDTNLDLKYSVAVNPRRQSAYVRSVILNQSGATVFLIDQHKEYSILFARILKNKFSEAGKDIPLDTIYDGKEAVYSNLRYKVSQDKSKVMFYYPTVKAEKVEKLKMLVLEKDLNILCQKEFAVSGVADDHDMVKALLANNGDAFFFIGKKIGDRRSEDDNGSYKFHSIDCSESKLRKFAINLNERMFSDPSFEYDNKNNHIVMSGFIAEEKKRNKKASTGFFSNILDPETGSFKSSTSANFSNDFMYNLTGKDTAKNDNKLYTFKIKDKILRNDGGALIIAESFYKETDQVNLPSSMNPSFSSYRSYSVYYYNDIIAFSMSPTGNIDWYSIMRKKQISENDNGAFSSFCLVNKRSKLHFIHLDEIYYRANIHEYVLDGNGTTERNVIMNQDEEEVMMIPKLGLQISPDEVVIPSLRKNLLSLVKISY